MFEIEWVAVPAGTLIRGTPPEQIDQVAANHQLPRHYFAKEAPQSHVQVPAFLISSTPVTLEQWSTFCSVVEWKPPAPAPGNLPVESATWAEATAFCEWLAQEMGADVRLPTETEWERAARGDDDREFPWGDTYDRAKANLAELGVGKALPVGSLPLGASQFGLLDMAGNVDEWTSSVYAPYPNAPNEVPPVEPQAFDPHVTRGGSYNHCRDLARCARRHGVYLPTDGAGFRVAQSVAG
jgi:formylglycine-generating enzyme required for sulfatase activity